MKKFLLALSLIFSLNAEIIEIDNLDQMTKHLSPDTLVILDIDNTIYHPAQYLGSDEWFCFRQAECGLDQALSEWMAVQNITAVNPIEKNTAKYIQNLQDSGMKVMGLTTRGLGMALCTTRQLSDLKIDLSKTAPSKEELFFTNVNGILFRSGILFTAGTHKGVCLDKLLKNINYTPKRVLFLNDKKSHLQPVEETCKELGIPFIGLRYGHADKLVKNFNPKIAKLQFEKFLAIMSDQEATALLEKSDSI